MASSKKTSKKNQPASKKYIELKMKERNKIARITKHLYKRVVLFLRRENKELLKDIEARLDVKKDILTDVRFAIGANKNKVWHQQHIISYAKQLGYVPTID